MLTSRRRNGQGWEIEALLRAKGGVYSDLPIADPGTQGLSAMSNVDTTGVGLQIWSRMVLSWAHHVTFSVPHGPFHSCTPYLECVPRSLLLSTDLSPLSL